MFQTGICRPRPPAGVHLEDVFPRALIWQREAHLPVKSPRAPQGRVDGLWPAEVPCMRQSAAQGHHAMQTELPTRQLCTLPVPEFAELYIQSCNATELAFELPLSWSDKVLARC